MDIDYEKMLMYVLPYMRDSIHINYITWLFSAIPLCRWIYNYLQTNNLNTSSGINIETHTITQRCGNDKIYTNKTSTIFKAIIHELKNSKNINKFTELIEIMYKEDQWSSEANYDFFPKTTGTFLYYFDYSKKEICDQMSDTTCKIMVETRYIKDDDNAQTRQCIRLYTPDNNTLGINVYTDYIKNKYEEYAKNKHNNEALYYFEIENIVKEDNYLVVRFTKKELNHTTSLHNIFINKDDNYNKDTLRNIIANFKNDPTTKNIQQIKYKEECNRIGIPWKLGICIHGPPGNGKTTNIKIIASETKRHIFCISLTKIKNNNELNKVFNTKQIDGIDIKNENIIYVLEDVDAQCEWIHDRNTVKQKKGALKEQSLKKTAAVATDAPVCSLLVEKETPTLDCLLNILNGPIDMVGAIVILSTNHPEMLDPALIRPGRIDLHIEFKNASLELIKEMFVYYFKLDNNDPLLDKLVIKDHSLSICKVQNILCTYYFNESNYYQKLDNTDMDSKKMKESLEFCEHNRIACINKLMAESQKQ
jgi:AAA+ superfamily predicted ATPase